MTKSKPGLCIRSLRILALYMPLLLLWVAIFVPSLPSNPQAFLSGMIVVFLLNVVVQVHRAWDDRNDDFLRERAVPEPAPPDLTLQQFTDVMRVIQKHIPVLGFAKLGGTMQEALDSLRALAGLLETKHVAAYADQLEMQGFVVQSHIPAPPGYREGDMPYDDLVTLQRATVEDLEQANHDLQVQEFEHGFERERHERYVALAEKHISALSDQNLMHHRINPRLYRPWRRRIK